MTMVVFWVSVAFVIIIYGIQIVRVVLYSKELRNESRNMCLFDVACADSVTPSATKNIRIEGSNWNEFYNEEGKLIKKEDYKQFFVRGNSMLLGGISDCDLVFVQSYSDKKLDGCNPCIAVLERGKEDLEERQKVDDKAAYKISRMWAECSMDLGDEEFKKIISIIINCEKFQKLQSEYPSKFQDGDNLISDFMKRLCLYKKHHEGCCDENNDHFHVVISTTLDTQTQKVHFSIHSRKMVVGEVKYDFKIFSDDAYDQVG